MSSKFGLALLLLCFVLLELSNAQTQQKQQLHQGYRLQGKYFGRNMGGSIKGCVDVNATNGEAPSINVDAVDGTPNNLASNVHDRFKHRH